MDTSAPAGSAAAGLAQRVLRLWLVEDNDELRELFAQLLNEQPGLRCVQQFSSAEAVLDALAEERSPDTILLDNDLGGRSGLSAIQPIKKLAPSVKVMMWTMFGSSVKEAQAFKSGASGFLLKRQGLDEIAKLIRAAHDNPDAPDLFPNQALFQEDKVSLEVTEAVSVSAAKRFSLVGALRQLCGIPLRETAR